MKYFVLLIIIGSIFLPSCAPSDDNSLRVSMSLSDEEWDVMKEEIFPGFEKTHECKIKAIQIEAGDLPQTLQAMINGKKMAIDVFAQDNMHLSILVEDDLVEDLTQYRDIIPKEAERSLIKAGEFNEKLYFMPYRPNVQVVYYNTEAFKKYGLRPPKTWQQLLHVAKTFKDKEGVSRVLLKAWGSGPTTTQVYEFIVSAGGDPFSFNDQGCVKAFSFLQELWQYCSPDSMSAKWNTSNDYIARESVYLMQNWPFGINVILEDYQKENIMTYSGWRGPKREAHVVGGEVLGIPTGSPKQKLAIKFIMYMQTKEVQKKLMSKLSWPSMREDAYVGTGKCKQPYMDSVRTALENGVFRKNVSYWADFDRFMNEAFTRIVIKGQNVEEVLNHYAKEMKKIAEL